MTIINSTASLRNFPYRVLPRALIQRLLQIQPENSTKQTTLKLFECYCDLTNVDLNKPKTLRITVLRFVGALSDQSLVSSIKLTRFSYARHIVSIYNELNLETDDEEEINWTPDLPDLHALYWREYPISRHMLNYWHDWSVTSRKKENIYLPFPKVYLTHGKEFTLSLHTSIKQFFATQARPLQSPFAIMLKFISANHLDWPVQTFSDSRAIWRFFVKLREHFFLRAADRHLAIEIQKKLWNNFLDNINTCFIASTAWTTPYQVLPLAPTAELDPSKTRIKTKTNGKEVSTKLITEIPLHITDKQALDLLFRDIEQELEIIINWATTEANKLIDARKNRDRLAGSGTPIESIIGGKSLDELGLNNVCATFLSDGYRPDHKYFYGKFGFKFNKGQIAKILALPSSVDLFPFQCLLVAKHPILTAGFFYKFELYNNQGHLSGFVQTNSGYQLIGFKDRKKSKGSEQKINLTPETTLLIQELIELTRPMREYLKQNNNDQWRYLFLSSSRAYGKPSLPRIARWNYSTFLYKNTTKRLSAQFAPHTTRKGHDLFELLNRVSLSSIRVSSAIARYIEHKNPELLAQDLGHTNYTPRLLSHYLPTEILNFFQSKYIRAFQTAMICAAMGNSPHLLDATKLRSMDELHEFLSLYALKDIPTNLSGRDDFTEASENPSLAYISVSPTTLSILISLQKAVESATSNTNRKISSKALYWTSFAKHLVREIEAGNETQLKLHLSEALKNITPKQMDQIIYESF
ncbi:hypothetical protein [Pseudomonas sp. EA_105y_Pfl2_R69]|uniref:hypothetical protein n=1 Tax=Pseudomonas sp. EA_105y_Pfl2_R69 TaxID=3088683 RepID=UPI0030D84571